MNWLLLLLFFNSILGAAAVKIHFLYKEVRFSSAEVKSRVEAITMALKI